MLIVPRRKPNRQQVAKPTPLPPPIDGLNARDALANMDPKDAITLTNFFPQNNSVEIRRGHQAHVDTGTGAPVETLMTYAASDETQTLIAASSGFLIDVTTTAITMASGFTSDRWQYTNVTTPGGQFLILFNGASSGQTYDGSSFTPNGFTATGLTTADFINVCFHKERAWLVEKDTLNLYYGATQAIAGALEKFPLGSFCDLGGSLLACGTLSTTAGTSVDDFFCAVTDQGEVLMYQGTDPASSDTWGLAGRFRTGKPIGYRCLIRIGGDLCVITTDGVISLRKALQFARGQQDRAAVTDKIQDHFNTHARESSTNFGWEALVYPKGHYVIFNIPDAENALQHQMVMNANTGAWCEFNGLNANTWALLDDNLYFGGNDGVVYRADINYTDANAPITATMKSAFNYMGTPQQKFFTMLRPVFASSGEPTISISVSVDFGDTPPTSGIAPTPATPGATWGSITWGSWIWGGQTVLTRNWQTAGAIGFCAAVGLQVISNGQSFSLQSFDVVAQPGGVL